ncbi:MAG TPA: LysM domain-containing protein [Gammaproteobacteria bacterium]|nr:LysM domain-containing protein [Gammaproteobacteria bacterium]
MFHARKPLVRSACLVALSAAGVFIVTAGLAQERASRLELAAVGQPSSPPALNPRHPDSYTVKRGDTLWDIAGMFLRDPWYWPEIWQINPQIENPHLIFPGDVLSLAYLNDGRPVVTVERGPFSGGGGVERLSPRIREEPLEEAIPTIPYETLAAFLARPSVLDKDTRRNAPYIVAQREGLLGSAGHDVYARGTDAPVGSVFNVIAIGNELRDPDNKDVLGYQGIYVGQGRVDRTGDPATVHLIDSAREAAVGDLLLQEEDVLPFNFLPHAPQQQVEGRIMSVLDGVSLIGQYQVVVINRGANSGLEPGNVLRVYKTGRTIRDDVPGHGVFHQKVRLPDEPAGTMMVFRTFDRISYALVMEATDAIAVLDTVRNPQ